MQANDFGGKSAAKKPAGDSSCRSVVRITGLEPARGVPPEPKSGASASFAISADEKSGNDIGQNSVEMTDIPVNNKKQPQSTDRLKS